MIYDLVGVAGGLVVGFVVGFCIEHVRYGNDIKLERRRTVSPILADVEPTLDGLLAAARYACQLKGRDDGVALKKPLKSVLGYLEDFRAWDDKHRGAGLSINLSHLDGDLNESLKSLRVYALNASMQKDAYVVSVLEVMSTAAEECLSGIRRF